MAHRFEVVIGLGAEDHDGPPPRDRCGELEATHVLSLVAQRASCTLLPTLRSPLGE